MIRITKILKESSFIAAGGIGDSDNGGDWTPPGQKKVLDEKDLCGYAQLKFPITDNPFGKSDSFRLEFVRISNPELDQLAGDFTENPSTEKNDKVNKSIDKMVKSLSKSSGGKDFKLAKSAIATKKEKREDEITINISEKYSKQIYDLLN